MPDPGDVVTVDFVGATGIKRRLTVVVSSIKYHHERPDLILGVLTTTLRSATASTDYVIAGLAGSGITFTLRISCLFRHGAAFKRAKHWSSLGP